MSGFIYKLSHFGIRLGLPEWKRRNVIVTNSISLIAFLVVGLLIVVHNTTHPGEIAAFVALPFAFSFLSVPFINRTGAINTGRTVLTATLIFGTLFITIARKMDTVGMVSEGTYFTSRIALLVFCIVPLATFHFRERKFLILNFLLCFAGLFLFDPIHNAVGLGYYQTGHTDPDYYYMNFIFFVIYAILIATVIFFKKEMENGDLKNQELIKSLHSQNDLIEHQKEELESQGEVLKELIEEKDKDLSQVTQQLIHFNHELLQYAYTVSHNLRGPVARMLGLIDLHKNYSNEDEQKQIIELIQTSALELDSITGHLNKIVEIRSDSFSVRETVKFADEVKKIVSLLKGPIHDHKVRITTDFSVAEIFSVRQRINHILFTLISNAIQYRNPDQSPQIRIHTRREKDQVVMEVEDNGRGIDLNLYRADLFKPFKYFHPDTSGRGVGLYLAKLQAERLHGNIDVRSVPGEGSTFLVYLKDWSKQD